MQETIVRFPVEERTREVATLQKGLFDLINRYSFDNSTALAPLILRSLALLVEHPEVKANALLHLGYLELELHWHLRISRETELTIQDIRSAYRAPSVLEDIQRCNAPAPARFGTQDVGRR